MLQKDITLAKCSWFYDFDEVMGRRPNIKPPFLIQTAPPKETGEEEAGAAAVGDQVASEAVDPSGQIDAMSSDSDGEENKAAGEDEEEPQEGEKGDGAMGNKENVAPPGSAVAPNKLFLKVAKAAPPPATPTPVTGLPSTLICFVH